MPIDNEDNAPRRRVLMRRGRGFSAGGSAASSRSESLRSSAEDDEIDAAIDPAEMNRRIREQSARPRAPLTPAMTPDDDDPNREDPRRRLNAVAMAGSASYSKEYRLTLLHRLLMRNVPLDQIAQQLQVSISTVEKDRVELKKRLRESAKEMHIDEMIGAKRAFYGEVSGMALRIASASGTGQGAVPIPMKLAALRTSLAAEADETRFLTSAGVFDVLRFRRAEDGSDLSDVQLLMQQSRELLENLDRLDADDEPEPVKPKRVSRSKPGSFKPLSFDDSDASSSASEVQEL